MVGVLRLRDRFAGESIISAQDDKYESGLRVPVARAVVGQAQEQQQQQPKERRDDDHLGEFFARVFHVHKEKDNQKGFEGGNEQGHDGIERAEIDERHGGRHHSKNHEPDPDRVIDFARNDVFRHGSPQRFPVDQIQEREQVDPDNVDEVPVESADFYRRIVGSCIKPLPGVIKQVDEDPDANDHVERVQAGHGEVQREINLLVRLVDVKLRILSDEIAGIE